MEAPLSLSTSSSRPTNAPSRVMGFRDLFLFYVVTGISLRWIATAAGHGPSSLVIWFLAWLLLYIPLALSVIHLSSRYPSEGGFYVWTKIAFGEQAGFLSAWMYWVSNLPYFPAVLYFAASNVLFLHPALQRYSQKPVYFVAFSVFILLGLTLLNILGLNLAKWAHNLGAIAMWIPALIIVVLGFTAWRHFGSATSFAPRNFLPTAHVQDMLFWSIVIFSFIGCESASLMAEEIKDARRNIPRALLLAGATVALCYMLGTFCVLLAIPSSESSNLDGLAQAVAHSAARLQLSGVTAFAAFFIVISNIGAAGAYLAAAARLPFVAGLDGSPRRFRQTPPPLQNSLDLRPRPGTLRHPLRLPRPGRLFRRRRLQHPRCHRRRHHHGPLHVPLRLHDPPPKPPPLPGPTPRQFGHSGKRPVQSCARLPLRVLYLLNFLFFLNLYYLQNPRSNRLPNRRLRHPPLPNPSHRRTPQTPLPGKTPRLHRGPNRPRPPPLPPRPASQSPTATLNPPILVGAGLAQPSWVTQAFVAAAFRGGRLFLY